MVSKSFVAHPADIVLTSPANAIVLAALSNDHFLRNYFWSGVGSDSSSAATTIPGCFSNSFIVILVPVSNFFPSSVEPSAFNTSPANHVHHASISACNYAWFT